MSHSQDAYRKVGRGGAGNFYQAKPAEDNGVKVRLEPLPSRYPIHHQPKPKAFPWFSWFKSPGAKTSNTRPFQDLEAQNPNPVADDTTNTAVSNSAANVQGQYARAGRGGAGNFFDPSTAREQQKEEDQAAANVKPTVQQSGAGRMALGGRGGAGNYHQKPQEDEHEKEGGKLKEVERKVMEHVEGLAKPPKALLAHERR
ncbi:hypothetical protein LIA77_04848 [Sarocladium implicatum]|nr:hypothetical protein LIA77_04848 [Sarocladium implicatum]